MPIDLSKREVGCPMLRTERSRSDLTWGAGWLSGRGLCSWTSSHARQSWCLRRTERTRGGGCAHHSRSRLPSSLRGTGKKLVRESKDGNIVDRGESRGRQPAYLTTFKVALYSDQAKFRGGSSRESSRSSALHSPSPNLSHRFGRKQDLYPRVACHCVVGKS